VVSFPQVFLLKPCMQLSPVRATYLAHLILLDYITRTLLGGEYRLFSSSFCSFLHSPVTSSLLDPNIFLITLFSDTLSLPSFLDVNDQVSHPYKTKGKIIVLWVLIVVFLDSELEDKNSAPNDSKHCLIFVNKQTVMPVVCLSTTYKTAYISAFQKSLSVVLAVSIRVRPHWSHNRHNTANQHLSGHTLQELVATFKPTTVLSIPTTLESYTHCSKYLARLSARNKSLCWRQTFGGDNIPVVSVSV
jgi:hypothetical protein